MRDEVVLIVVGVLMLAAAVSIPSVVYSLPHDGVSNPPRGVASRMVVVASTEVAPKLEESVSVPIRGSCFSVPGGCRGKVDGLVAAVGYGGTAVAAGRYGSLHWYENGACVRVTRPRRSDSVVRLASDESMQNVFVQYSTMVTLNGETLIESDAGLEMSDVQPDGSIWIKAGDRWFKFAVE